jgi:AcrR family transcriptional regulator
MVISTALLVRERGARATSIDDVLAHSGAPRGSVYHHFPGGRDQLLLEATTYAGEYVGRRLRLREDEDPLAAFDAFIAGYREDLLNSEMRSGCPVVAVAIECREEDSGLQAEAGRAFVLWQQRLAENFVAAGIEAARAADLAVIAIAAVEGALVMSRAQRDVGPLDRVRDELRRMLRAELDRPHGRTSPATAIGERRR